MIIDVQNIHKSYGKDKVLSDISFRMEKPEIVALVGPNGSGKSTLLSIVTNLLPADQGEVFILGKSNKDATIFQEISFMQDNSVLYEYLTGYDHLQFIGDVQGINRKEIIETADRIGMTHYLHKKVGKYSLGMKQHLLLTMAILNKPKLLLLDEPLNGLDPTSAIRVRHLLLELYKEGTTILLSSHNLAEIDRVTSHILFLKDGHLMKEDISLYEQIHYVMTVEPIEKAVTILAEYEVPIVQKEENQLTISIKKQTLMNVLQILSEKQIYPSDMEKKIIGTEERYQKIFGKGKEDGQVIIV